MLTVTQASWQSHDAIREVRFVPHKPLDSPLYQRVYGVLYQRIKNGEYPVGSALPAESQLAYEFSVSKATIRQAVGELVERAIVTRHQGKGTFVSEQALIDIPHPFVGSFADLIVGTHHLTIQDTFVLRGVPIPPSIRQKLQVTNTTGSIIRHHRNIEGMSFAYFIQYFPSWIDRYLKPDEFKPTGHVTLLRERGLQVSGAWQSMSAQLADVEVAEHLDVSVGAPVLFGERTLHSAEGPVEVVHTWYRGDLYSWQTELEYSWTGDRVAISVVTPDAAQVAPTA
jgi:GntR family transcriptional regulator